jgi:hypothetical protein
MWNWMSENDNTDGSGIIDPRCKVFFETNGAGEWKPQPQSGANPVQGRGAYINGAFPGGRDRAMTQEEWDNKGEVCYYSSVNYYIARDDQYMPEMFMTVAELHFLKAEAYNRGIGVSSNSGMAKDEYEAGIKSSIDFWYDMVELQGTAWAFYKPVLDLSEVDVYMANEKVSYKGDGAEALKQIYAQMWIDSFRQPWLGFNLYRRTLATPHDETGAYEATENNFYKVPYPEGEFINNPTNLANALDGQDNNEMIKIFWQK